MKNQSLTDTSCLVPCTGLYADVADDSLHQEDKQSVQALRQSMIEGIAGFIILYDSKRARE